MNAVSERTARQITGSRWGATPADPLLDADREFPDAQRFIAAWPRLRDEALWLAENMGVMDGQDDATPVPDRPFLERREWRQFVLRAYGLENRRGMTPCPMLSSLIAPSADILSASFAYLGPRKRVPLKRAPTLGVARFCLGLSVPLAGDGRPVIAVATGEQEHTVGEGGSLLWDQTQPLELCNQSDRISIALLLDVRRRGMAADKALLSRMSIAAARVMVRLRARR